MSNVGALLVNRGAEVGDGIYVERTEQRELALEEYLRGAVARLPQLKAPAKRWQAVVDATCGLESRVTPLDDDALKNEFRAACFAMQRAGFEKSLVARSFAAIREASRRTLGKRHYDVQLAGGWTLLQGAIAEMATGEGKTLVATLAASTAAAAGIAVHVVTVNDYLAERDAGENMPLYEFLGLTVGVIKQDMELPERGAQYARDIVYVSNKELVFDYLKDRIATKGALTSHLRIQALYKPHRQAPTLLRGLHMAIVDEADSVLIDEARTPLIISETIPDDTGGELYATAIDFAKRMTSGEHFDITLKREILVKPAGLQAIEELSKDLSGVWKSSIWRRELLQHALSALHGFQRDVHYIVTDNKVQIVDEFTGRVMPDRSWEGGLHQMVEAKEGCEITGQRRTLSQMTYQRYFRRYLLLGGMTGTAAEVAPEVRRVYDLEVWPVPTNKPRRRQRLPDSCWRTSEERWQAVAKRAAEMSRSGRPVLVGTRSVMASEHLSELLTSSNVDHTVLNARQDKTEADSVAQAGQPGRITVATNMAGRGTDIKLDPEVKNRGGLHVILTEFHESARVDRQLFGRSGRQGEPGTVEAMVSLEDELFVRFAPGLRALCLRGFSEGHILPGQLLRMLVRLAQSTAERYNRNIRMNTLKQDRKLFEMLGFAGIQR
ncbi:MAG: putative SecA domain protein/helicase [Betaproteobacteria bacterium]|nr:putative SecA domain protein/helicase [Betaproteobacteria bacterium]